MATERIDIVIREDGSRVVKRNIESIGTAAKGTDRVLGAFKRALGALSVGLVAKETLQLANTFQNLQNRLRVVTTGSEQLASVTQSLFEISQQTRSSFEGSVELYSRLAISSKELGVNQNQLLQFTKSLNQAIILSGATATEASAGLIQLSQGMASGTLRGDELRSVLEQLPAVADVIAKSLGVTRGELRAMGQDGKITANTILDAFAGAGDELEQRFSKTVSTTGQELTKLKNAMLLVVGKFFEASGAANGLAEAINSVTQYVIKMLPQILGLARAMGGVLTEQDELTSGTKVLASTLIVLQSVFIQLVGVLKNTVGTAFQAVGNQLGGLAAAIGAALSGEFAQAGEILSMSFSDTQDIVVASSHELRDQLISDTTDTIEKLVQVWDKGARLTAAAQKNLFENPNAGADGAVGKGSAVDPEAVKALEKLRETQQGFLDGLNEERAALELAVSANMEYADALQEVQIRQLEAQGGLAGFGNQARDAITAINALNAEIEKKNALEEDAARIIQAIQTPQQEFGTQLKRIEELYSAGKLSAEEYAAAITMIRDELIEATKETDPALDNLNVFLNRARENAQDILGGTLANLFTDGLDDVPSQVANMLKEIASQFLASEIFRMLGQSFGGGGGGAGGGFGGMLQGFFAGGFATGGAFMVPGSGGPDSQLAMLNVSPRERVTVETPQQQRTGTLQSAPPQVNVSPQIINVRDPSEIPAAMQGAQGSQVILNVIRDNPDTIRNLIQ